MIGLPISTLLIILPTNRIIVPMRKIVRTVYRLACLVETFNLMIVSFIHYRDRSHLSAGGKYFAEFEHHQESQKIAWQGNELLKTVSEDSTPYQMVEIPIRYCKILN